MKTKEEKNLKKMSSSNVIQVNSNQISEKIPSIIEIEEIKENNLKKGNYFQN